jgi:hypothetical protein
VRDPDPAPVDLSCLGSKISPVDWIATFVEASLGRGLLMYTRQFHGVCSTEVLPPVSAIGRTSLNQPGVSTHESRSSHSPLSVPVTTTPPNRLASMRSGSPLRPANAHCGPGRTLLCQAERVRSGMGAGLGPQGNGPAGNAAAFGARLAPPAVGSLPGASRRARWGSAGSVQGNRGASSGKALSRVGGTRCAPPCPTRRAAAGSGAGSGTCAGVEAS